jgi:hypothetical protein
LSDDRRIEYLERKSAETDRFKSAILRSREATYRSNGSVVDPKPLRPGSKLKSFEPRFWDAVCPDCSSRIGQMTVVYLNVDAAAPPGWKDDFDFDYASSTVPIGKRMTLEPGFVNAPRRSLMVDGIPYRWYRRSGRRVWTKPLRIATPAIVTCKCGCEMLLHYNSIYGEYATLPREEREAMMRKEVDADIAREINERNRLGMEALKERLHELRLQGEPRPK